MLGLMIAGLACARQGRFAAGFVLCLLAATVKMPAAVGALYPALAKGPAVFSKRVVNQELRGHAGFKGVTITDALDAQFERDRASLLSGEGMDFWFFVDRDGDVVVLESVSSPATWSEVVARRARKQTSATS